MGINWLSVQLTSRMVSSTTTTIIGDCAPVAQEAGVKEKDWSEERIYRLERDLEAFLARHGRR